MRQIVLWTLCLSVTTLIGCNTMKGMGKDVEKTGENIQDTVNKND